MSNATTRELLRLVAREYSREIVAVAAPFVGAWLAFYSIHRYAMRRMRAL